jgi:hypothetical protein
MKKNFNETVNGVASVASTECTNNQQWTKYHNKSGHGFAAEDANALWEKWHGKSVKKVGINNAKNGPDRITSGVPIQTKYCTDACKSVNAAFKDGTYSYPGMKLEVPKDQYDVAVRIMRDRIAEGKVPGISDPSMADQIVVKGHYTYDEAVRIAKAGNLDSIKFDIRTQAVACAFSFGLSFVISYFSAKSNGMSHEDSLKYASKQAAKSGVSTLITGVAAQQLLRTQVGRNFAAVITHALKPVMQAAVKTEICKTALTKTATVIAGKEVTGVAAANVLTKAVRTNAVISSVVLVGTTIPDAVKFCRGKITGREFAENTTSNTAGVGGGWAGASAGAAIGSVIFPGVGTVVGGIIGGLGGGIGASLGVKKVFSIFK